MSPLLEVDNISRRFSGSRRAALHDVSFSVREGEMLTLIGASGSGKTSLLRIVAGLESADRGEIRLSGEVLNSGPRIMIPPERRHIGLVFQNHALFPHLRVRDNVGFGLGPGEQKPEKVAQLLDMVGLGEMGRRYPHELSGGERQRVALARALAPRPRLLLLDEPFSSMDLALRNELREDTVRLIRQGGTTTIFVTHDPEDALAVSDRIVVLSEGQVLQVGTPEEIYRQPSSREVALAFGVCNFLSAVDFPRALSLPEGHSVRAPAAFPDEIWLRPEDLRLTEPGDPMSLAQGVVTENLFQGESRLVKLACTAPTGHSLNVVVRHHGDMKAPVGGYFGVLAMTSGERAGAANSSYREYQSKV